MSNVVINNRPQTNHSFHLIMTLVTCFMWTPVWIIVTILNAGKSRQTTVATGYPVQPVYVQPPQYPYPPQYPAQGYPQPPQEGQQPPTPPAS